MKIELIGDAIVKDGEQIGTYNASANTATFPGRISPALFAPIKEALGGVKPEYVFNDGIPTRPEIPQSSMVSEENSERGEERLPHETLVAEPEPTLDPKFGDKTPAFVIWLCRTNPAEAVRRYRDRVMRDPDVVAALDEAAKAVSSK